MRRQQSPKVAVPHAGAAPAPPGPGAASAPPDPSPPWAQGVARVAGAMMVGGAGLNTYMVIARPGSYAGMGAWFQGLSPWSLGRLPDLWTATFGRHPRVWVPLVGIGFEATIGVLALSRDPRRRVAGLGGIAAFHTGLLGMGLWSWALPWLGVLVPAAVVTARSGAVPSGAGTVRVTG